jgi:DnaJ like chaperone protein
MKWIGKAAGGLLGFVAARSWYGAVLGVLLGHQFDMQGAHAGAAADPIDLSERFFRATYRVMGCIAKADGVVSEAEIAAARAVMAGLTDDQVHEAIACFGAGKQPDFDLTAELTALAQACRGHPDLARVFLEIQMRAAIAGNDLQGPARPLMISVATALGVSRFDLAQIEMVLRIQGAFAGAQARNSPGARTADLAEAYKVLDTAPEASDGDIVKAYRRQLSRHHPDKLKAHGLPESMMTHAKRRTQQIIEAYELIRERRGMN